MSAIRTVTASLAALALAGSAAVAQQQPTTTGGHPATGAAATAPHRDSATHNAGRNMAGAKHRRKPGRHTRKHAARAAHDSASAMKSSTPSTAKPR